MTNEQAKTEMTIKLKTFNFNRELYTFKVSSDDSVISIIEKLAEIESSKNIPIENRWTKGKQYRLFSTETVIRELNPKLKFSEEKIKDNTTLLILPQKKMCFSTYMKGSSISLIKSNQIAIKSMDDFQYILGSMPFSFGKHYYEICLLTEPLEKNIVVGVCSKKDSKSLYIYDVKNFYGFVLSDLKSMTNINNKIEYKDFGEVTKIFDRIGVLIEFTNEGVNISYYVNKMLLGTPFTKLQEKIVFPCVRLGIETTKVMITNQVDFPDV